MYSLSGFVKFRIIIVVVIHGAYKIEIYRYAIRSVCIIVTNNGFTVMYRNVKIRILFVTFFPYQQFKSAISMAGNSDAEFSPLNINMCCKHKQLKISNAAN